MLGKEASEFVEPERAVDVGRRGGYEQGCFVGEGHGCCGISFGAGVLVVKCFEVLLQLKGRIELCTD